MLGKWLSNLLLKQEGKRNPLGAPPLRLPGQALADELDEAMLGWAFTVVFPLVLPVLWFSAHMFTATAGRGWPDRSQLLLELGCWLLLVAMFWGRAWRGRSRIRNLRLGMLAERAVGQQLERCRTAGYRIFHDIPCQGGNKPFNIDHLAIGPGGVFVVETKARSKPEKGQTVAWLEGNAVRFSDGAFDPNAISQAEAIANHVASLLKPMIRDSKPLCRAFTPDRPLPVRPILAYPGWYTDRKEGEWHHVLLANTEGAVGFIRKSERKLTDEEALRIAKLFGEHLREQRKAVVEN